MLFAKHIRVLIQTVHHNAFKFHAGQKRGHIFVKLLHSSTCTAQKYIYVVFKMAVVRLPLKYARLGARFKMLGALFSMKFLLLK